MVQAAWKGLKVDQCNSTENGLGYVQLFSEGEMGRKWGVYEKLMRSEGGSMKII